MKRISDLLGPSPYTGEQPETEQRSESLRRDYSVSPERPPEEFNWVMSPTHVSVGKEDHQELFSQVGGADPNKPHAYGLLNLYYNWDALWEVSYSNMNLQAVEKKLKKYTKAQNWQFEDLVDGEGQPYMNPKQSAVPGIGEINPGVKDWKNKEWSGMEMYDNPGHEMSDKPFYGLADYDEDMPMSAPRVCSECGELLPDYNEWRLHVQTTHINPERKPPRGPQPVVDMDDVLPANFNEVVMDKTVQRQSSLIWQLGGQARRAAITAGNKERWEPGERAYFEYHCNQAHDSAHAQWWYRSHQPVTVLALITSDAPSGWSMDDRGEGGTPRTYRVRWDDGEEGDVFEDELLESDADFDRNAWCPPPDWKSRLGPVEGSIKTARSAGGFPKVNIPGPIPFIYDIEKDRIFVGHPGERHSDIQGRFTPGGILEGMYDPKGGVQIRTDTDMPYTVRHMIQLWYAMHPELEVKAVYLLVGDQRYKLASSNIGHKVRNIAATDPAVWAVYEALAPVGKVYVVGGAVRDIILGKTPKDIDLMVQGVNADQIEKVLQKLPGRVDYTGKQFGVFRYRDQDGNEVEIAMPRTERSTGPGHKDFEVYTDPNITVEQDLSRRDFTGNAMAVDLETGKLYDPYRGAEDLKSKVLETVSERSFSEDPLRILRALAAVSRHQLSPTKGLYRQLKQNLDGLDELPMERIQAELDKIMAGDDPGLAFEIAADTGVLEKLIPELNNTVGFDQQNKWHSLLLFDHIREVLQIAVGQSDNIDLRWAALLHDVGKPPSQWVDDDGFAHYYQNEEGQGQQHEIVGADMAREILTRLKFPTDRIDRISSLVRWHMYPPFSGLSGARKFVNRVGDDLVDDLLELRWADSGGKDKGNPMDGSVDEMRALIQQVRDSRQPTDRSGLAINGNDLIAAGFPPGPQMGVVIEYLTQAVLEDPGLNNKEILLQMAQNYEPDSTPKMANILDPIQTALDPDVFKKPGAAHPEVHDRIIKWVKTKLRSSLIKEGWPDPQELGYLNIILTGSLTTYQWSESSDFDVSLWIISERLPEWVRADLIRIMIEDIDGTIVPGTTHPMQVFVVDSDRLSPADLYRPGMRSAYNLDTKEWIVPPERNRVKNVYDTYPSAIAYARMVEDKVRILLRYNSSALEIYYKFLHHQRQRDMIAGKGDYSLNNIVYKWLANRGLLGEISGATGLYIA